MILYVRDCTGQRGVRGAAGDPRGSLKAGDEQLRHVETAFETERALVKSC